MGVKGSFMKIFMMLPNLMIARMKIKFSEKRAPCNSKDDTSNKIENNN